MDIVLRKQVLKALSRDRMFLKTVCHDVSASDFPDRSEQIVADIALKFWEDHNEPVGGLLRSDAEDAARHLRLSPDDRKKLRGLVDEIQGGKMELVPVRALEDRVVIDGQHVLAVGRRTVAQPEELAALLIRPDLVELLVV